MARHKPIAVADLDQLVAAITVDAYGDDEPQPASVVAAGHVASAAAWRPLFDLPEPERRPQLPRSEQGRAGMTYTRSVTADIQLRHRSALCQAAVRVFDTAPVLAIGEVDDAEDDQA